MEILYGLGFLTLFSLSAVGGAVLRVLLPEEHLSKENMDAVRLVTELLVTFVALVLSFQLLTGRSAFNAASKNRSIYAAELVSLDQCLRNLGASMEPTRLRLRQYTAAVIASTWPHEPAPNVEGMPDASRMAIRGEDPTLAKLINEIGLAIDSVSPQDPAAANTAARCRATYVTATQARWGVIEDTHAPSGDLYVIIISLWLALVFLSFGLQIPRRRLPAIVLAIGVVCVASVVFVIVDLNTPYGGLFGISSSAMRDALTDMSR
jgi:hypothetical protein